MSWSYRVVKKVLPEGIVQFSLCEVMYGFVDGEDRETDDDFDDLPIKEQEKKGWTVIKETGISTSSQDLGLEPDDPQLEAAVLKDLRDALDNLTKVLDWPIISETSP